MITLTRQECVDLISDKVDEFKTIDDWHNFDIEKWLAARGACNADIRLIAEKYEDYLANEVNTTLRYTSKTKIPCRHKTSY
jgi:hypothetical protein